MQPDFEGFRLLAEHLKDPSRGEEVVTDKQGRRWRARPNPGQGVRLVLESVDTDAPPMTMYDPAESRASSYPEDLPFVPGVPAAVAGVPSTPPARMVIWSEMTDADAVAQQVQAAGEADGWETIKPMTSFGGFPIMMAEARKGSLRRHLSLMAAGDKSVVMLMQSSDA